MRGHTTKRKRHAKRQHGTALAGILFLALAAVALTGSLAAQNAPPAAGGITALIPKDFIQRGRSAPLEAKKGAAVQWEDVIRTEQGGRVRVTLTDGSVLNIGSQSQLKILQQDAASEQSQLELIYGKVRADVIKRTRPDGEFTVRTPTAVAGVIGTGEYLEATPTETVVIALNGIVAVSSNNPTISGQVFLKPGKKTRVLHNQPPGPPEDATEEELENAHAQTSGLPGASLQPRSAQPGTSVAALLTGIDLTGVTGLTFSHDGLSATLGESSEQGLGVTVNVAEDVPPGRYTFSVWAGAEPAGEGRFIVLAPGEGASLRALDVHLPPDPVITGEWYYDPQQPPLPLLTGSLEVGQGALLRLSGVDSSSADGHPITEFDWDIPGTSIRGSGPTFELDTWQLQPGSRRVRLRVFDDDRHSARVELDLEIRDILDPHPDELIPNCLVGGYEAQDVNQFMSCFSADFRAYPVLYESIQTFLRDASEVRVYSRIDNHQILRDDANYQVTFNVSFSTDAAPTLIQTRTEQLTLRMHLYREADSEQWLITDFSSQVVATGSGTGSEGFSPDFAVLLDPTAATLAAGGPPLTITVTVQPLGGFTESVQLNVTGLPPDVSANFGSSAASASLASSTVSASASSITVPAGTSTPLTLTPGLAVPADSFNVQVIGSRNNLQRTALLELETESLPPPPPNNPPVALDDAFTVLEDSGATLVSVLANDSDPDGDPLSITAVSTTANGSALISGSQISYSPNPNFFGSDSFTYSISDGQGGSDTATVTLTVSPVNDPPVLTVPGPQAADEGQLLSFTVSATDLDNDPLTFSASGLPAGASFDPATQTFSWTPDFAQMGDYTVSFLVSDGALTDSETVLITVGNVNRAPTADAASLLTDEDTPLGVTLTGSDPDGDPLTFTVASSPAKGTLSGVAPNLTYTPAANLNGSDSFTFTVSDGSLTSAAATVSLTLNPVNDPPVIDSIPNQTVTEGNSIPVTATGTDPDAGDTLTFSLGGGAPTFVSLIGATLSISPGTGDVGSYSITVVVTDSAGASASTSFNLQVNGVPGIDVSPASLSFGDVLVGNTSAAQTVTISNTGTSDLTVSSITLGGSFGFALSLPALSPIPPGNFVTFDVTFAPLAAGLVGDTVTVTSDAGSPTVTLSGTGVAPLIDVSPASHDFGSILVGFSALQTFTIDNTGTADLVVSAIAVGGGAGFAVSSSPSLSATVAPSGSITFDVSFSPLAGGSASDTVTIDSNAANSPTLVSLNGLGVSVAPSVQLIKTAGSAADGVVLSVTAGTSVTYSYQVTNSGDTELVNVAVTDSVLGSVGTIALLASGASQTLTATATINADVTNVGTVTGTPASGGVSLGLLDVSDTDNAVVDVVGPSVQLIKTAGAAPDGSVLPLVSGTSVTYSYEVTNTGDTELINLAVSDSVLGGIGTIPTLAAGASATLSSLATPINADVTNLGSVTGTPASGGVSLGLGDVSDTDDAVVDVVGPSVQLIKTAASTTASAPDGTTLTVDAGTSVTYSYQVTNSGDTELINVTVTDDVLDSIGTIALLASGASQTLTSVPTMVNADVTNLGTVTATPSLAGVGLGLPDVSDTDGAVVTVLVASISVSPASVNFGDVVVDNTGSVTLIVTNTGSATLSINSISTNSPDCVNPFSFAGISPGTTVPAGFSVTFSATFTPTRTGACTGTLTITSNAATSPTTVSLSGSGANNTAFDLSVTNDSDGSANSNSNPLQVVRGASAGATAVAINPTGFSGQVTITIASAVPAWLTITCVDIGGGSFNNCPSPTEGQVFLNQPQDDSVGFSFAADVTAPLGLFAVQFEATGGGTTQVYTVYIEVVDAASGLLAGASARSSKGGKRAGSRRGRGRDPEPTEEPGEVVPADLEIVAAQVQLEPGQPQAGESLRVLVPVRNLGGGAAENFTLTLNIPSWNVRAEQTLSLAGHEGAVVEFAFDVPAGFAGGPVWARIVADPENQVLDSNRANNRARVANLVPAGSGGAAPVVSTQGAAELGLGDCVSFRLNGAAPADCGEGSDFQLRADLGRLTLSAEAVRDLGPGPLTGSASGTGGSGGRAAVQVGHVYEITGGARRAQVRVVRLQQSSARKSRSGKAGHDLPPAFDGPRVNDPFQLPNRNRARRPATIQVQVELEWVILP